MNVTLKVHYDTRWSTKKQAVSALKHFLECIFKLLKLLKSTDITLNHDTRVYLKQNLIC